MTYEAISLNGAWEMHYREQKYTGTENPFRNIRGRVLDETEPIDHSRELIEGAVPGYWEDMTEAFMQTSWFGKLRVNPEYGLQQYPMAGNAPDMALPNIVGNFFYRREFEWEAADAAGGLACDASADTGGGFCDAVAIASGGGAENTPAVIHFEGVQNAVSVWLNDVFLGLHEGYSTPFDMEIPDGVLRAGKNTVVLSVSNHRLEGYAGEPVSGLTSRAANEYTGGITGNVELRVYRSPLRDVDIRVSEDCENVTVHVEMIKRLSLTWAVYDGDRRLRTGESSGDFSFDTHGLKRWSPEEPKLYTLKITCGDSCLSRIFGVRRLTVDGVHFRLNGQPYYLRGICEHCYFPETIHPNHDYAYYRSIIKAVKNLGFNFIRFHTYIPEEEYLRAADELGILLHVESPNNTTVSEWKEIVNFCCRHPSVVIYCCGNELMMDDPFIEHLHRCADIVHGNTDALFSPMNAMRGLEYLWVEPDQEAETLKEPFKHHPRRIRTVGGFSDLFSSYPNGQHSYFSLNADPEKVDDWRRVYNKPRVSHEICIDGTYTDLSLKDRYRGTRVGRTDMFTSIERHLEKKGLLKRAPLYFKNSSEWQRRVRKYCFEAVRRSQNMAGYDFLGPIDTHWHTFGYDVGMMNEFYELKPGETVRNVLMYNSATVLLTDLGRRTNFTAGEPLDLGLYVSHYGKHDLSGAQLTVRLSLEGEVIERRSVQLERVENGAVSRVYDFSVVLPEAERPGAMKLYVTLDGDGLFVENEWELYLFPKAEPAGDGEKLPGEENCGVWQRLNAEEPGTSEKLVISKGMELSALVNLLKEGKDVLLFGAEPFVSLPTTFRIALAGRTSGNLATVISDHPALGAMPHEGFCGWQFGELLEGGKAVCFETDAVPFDPIIEVVSTHKYAIRQAALFEFRVMNCRLLVCSFNVKDTDPAGRWLRSQLISYARSGAFDPKDSLDEAGLMALATGKVRRAEANTNFAFNANDKTAVRRK